MNTISSGRVWVAAALGVMLGVVVLLGVSGPVYGDATFTFTGGVNGWAGSCGFSSTVGHNANGSLYTNTAPSSGMAEVGCRSQLIYLPSSASIEYYAFGDGSVFLSVYSLSGGGFGQVSSCSSNSSAWTQCTYDLSGYGLGSVQVEFSTFNTVYIDDVTISGSVVSNIPESAINGVVQTSGSFWLHRFNSGHFDYDSTVTRSAGSGSFKYDNFGTGHYVMTVPFVLASTDWSIWYYSDSAAAGWAVGFADYSDYNADERLETHSNSVAGAWTEVTFSFDAGTVGHVVQFYLRANNSGSVYYLDELCPAVCGDGSGVTPTASPTATNTPLPTSTPIPTDTPSPTWTPNFNNPTPIYGQGTPAPVGGGGSTGLCPPDDPCYVVVQNTPLPVDILGVGGTPISAGGGIPIQGGNSTPVSIVYATVPVTAIPADPGGVSVGSAETVFASGDIGDPMPVSAGGMGSADAFVGVGIEKNDVSFCLPSVINSIVNLDVNGCAIIPVYTVVQYKLLGVDLLPYFAAIGIAFFIVFVLRNLQER